MLPANHILTKCDLQIGLQTFLSYQKWLANFTCKRFLHLKFESHKCYPQMLHSNVTYACYLQKFNFSLDFTNVVHETSIDTWVFQICFACLQNMLNLRCELSMLFADVTENGATLKRSEVDMVFLSIKSSPRASCLECWARKSFPQKRPVQSE